MLGIGLVLAALGTLCGCEENEPGCDAQGRFLSELLRQNEACRVSGDGQWLDPKACGSSTEFITRLAHVRGIVATELPVWVADWEVVVRPSADASAPLAFKRLVREGKVVVLRRNRTVDIVTSSDFQKEQLNN